MQVYIMVICYIQGSITAELGDFLEDEYTDSSYLSSLKLLPGQTEEVEIKIMEHHREHVYVIIIYKCYLLTNTSMSLK